MASDERATIHHEADIVSARQKVRALAALAGFAGTELVLIATATSEIARNMLQYAQGGELEFSLVHSGTRAGIAIVASDRGPGIPDIERAMQDGFSTANGLGLGLPGARRLVDEFAIESTVGVGTKVVMKKWVPR